MWPMRGAMADRRRSSRLMVPKTPRFWPEMNTRRGCGASCPRYLAACPGVEAAGRLGSRARTRASRVGHNLTMTPRFRLRNPCDSWGGSPHRRHSSDNTLKRIALTEESTNLNIRQLVEDHPEMRQDRFDLSFGPSSPADVIVRSEILSAKCLSDGLF